MTDPRIEEADRAFEDLLRAEFGDAEFPAAIHLNNRYLLGIPLTALLLLITKPFWELVPDSPLPLILAILSLTIIYAAWDAGRFHVWVRNGELWVTYKGWEHLAVRRSSLSEFAAKYPRLRADSFLHQIRQGYQRHLRETAARDKEQEHKEVLRLRAAFEAQALAEARERYARELVARNEAAREVSRDTQLA